MRNLKDLPQIKLLNEDEEKVFYSIVSSSLTENGLDLRKLDLLYYADYSEIPVTIDKFLEDDRYLGKVFNNGKGIYPFWREKLYQIFHDNPDHAFEICLTGSIGQGKSTIAVVAMLYHLYQVLCLKNPQEYYGLTANAPIVFVCLNLTLDLAWSGLYSMAVSAIQMSPWFLEKCDIRGTVNYTVSFPNHIELMCASSLSHVIGKNVKCLAGYTIVLTEEGWKKLEDIEGEYHTFYSLDDKGNLTKSIPAITIETKRTDTLIEIELEDGSILRCTPEHRFLLKSGEYKEAQYLTEDDELEEVSV